MYCDLVARTGKKFPIDRYSNDTPSIKAIEEGTDKAYTPWLYKVKSFMCCKRPSRSDQEKWNPRLKAQIIGVLSKPERK